MYMFCQSPLQLNSNAISISLSQSEESLKARITVQPCFPFPDPTGSSCWKNVECNSRRVNRSFSHHRKWWADDGSRNTWEGHVQKLAAICHLNVKVITSPQCSRLHKLRDYDSAQGVVILLILLSTQQTWRKLHAISKAILTKHMGGGSV